MHRLYMRLRAMARHIPGFRSLSSSSMAVAITYYAAAIAIAFVSWPWGMALLAVPFFAFTIVDLEHAKSRRAAMVTAGIAGVLLLAGIALGLGAQGYRVKTIPAHPVLARATGTTVLLTPSATATADPTMSPAPSATPSAASVSTSASNDPTAVVYVASKSGKTFHLPGCSSAKNIKPENRIEYKTRAQAIAAGLNPCKRCKP